MKTTSVFVVGLVAFVSLASALGAKPNKSHTEEAFELLKKAAKSAMCEKLKDCDSAKFKNLIVKSYEKSDGSKALVVCGEVNAKNSFGAYTGYETFALDDPLGTPQLVSKTIEGVDFTPLLIILCG